MSNTLLPKLYKTMKRIRTFEERVSELFIKGESAGTMLHLSIGEELGPACVGTAMRDSDTFTTHHRGHGIFVARGGDPNRMLAEIAGKKDGYCKCKGGSMHIADMKLGHLGANAIVGGQARCPSRCLLPGHMLVRLEWPSWMTLCLNHLHTSCSTEV